MSRTATSKGIQSFSSGLLPKHTHSAPCPLNATAQSLSKTKAFFLKPQPTFVARDHQEWHTQPCWDMCLMQGPVHGLGLQVPVNGPSLPYATARLRRVLTAGRTVCVLLCQFSVFNSSPSPQGPGIQFIPGVGPFPPISGLCSRAADFAYQTK